VDDVVSSEIKETVMIAVASILLASLLGFVSFLMMVRSDFASVRNSEVNTAQAVASYKEFNKYNGDTLFGEDVVAAVRDFYDTGVKIRVNNVYAGSIKPLYDVDKYLVRSKDQTDGVYDEDLVAIQNLYLWFPTNRTYKAVLVYGNVDLTTITETYVSPEVSKNVSAIVFFYKGLRVG
jgi:peptidoglycan hydrolase-like protein with peptidoglycan-binding domain